MKSFPDSDLEHIFKHTHNLWSEHFSKGSTLFITGGTGFFGKWLLESFLFAGKQLSHKGTALVLSRDPEKFLRAYPHFRDSSVQFIRGDVCTFSFPPGKIDYIIHAATPASADLNSRQPLLMFDIIAEGTRRVLELAKEKNVKAILHTSSGAVYGKQPAEVSHLPEEYPGAPSMDDENAAYGEGKRVAEMLCHLYYRNFSVHSKIARCFAFAGPGLPLDRHFAAGQFVRDVFQGDVIRISGDGSPCRSYMYPSDLCIWLWTILFTAPSCRPYNVGSEESISIRELAELISVRSGKKMRVEIASAMAAGNPSRYVPSVKRAREELGLKNCISLPEAIDKMIAFGK